MFRLVLWRSCFELFNLLKIAGFRGKPVLYFAFGGNLSPSLMETRRISVLSSLPFLLDDYKLVFDQQGPFEGGGFASVNPTPGSSVLGMIYAIPKIDELRMDYFEATLFLRKYRKVHKDTLEGRVYFYQTRFPKEGLSPTRKYYDGILKAYEAASPLAGGNLEELKRVRVLENEVAVTEGRLLIRDYACLGKYFRPLLAAYDRVCFWIFLKLVFRPSIFGNLVPR